MGLKVTITKDGGLQMTEVSLDDLTKLLSTGVCADMPDGLDVMVEILPDKAGLSISISISTRGTKGGKNAMQPVQ